MDEVLAEDSEQVSGGIGYRLLESRFWGCSGNPFVPGEGFGCRGLPVAGSDGLTERKLHGIREQRGGWGLRCGFGGLDANAKALALKEGLAGCGFDAHAAGHTYCQERLVLQTLTEFAGGVEGDRVDGEGGAGGIEAFEGGEMGLGLAKGESAGGEGGRGAEVGVRCLRGGWRERGEQNCQENGEEEEEAVCHASVSSLMLRE